MKNVLITGCSSGFGRLAALTLAARRDRVFATVRRRQDAEELRAAAKDLPLTTHLLDVNDQPSIAKVTSAIADQGGLDALVNNAGFMLRGPLSTLNDQELRAQFETNVFGVLRMVRAVTPMLEQRGGGTIVNISSLAGLIGVPFEGAYVASKYALEGLSEVLRLELAPAGIKVHLVEPGTFSTGFESNIIDAKEFSEDHPQRAVYEHLLSARRAALTAIPPPDPERVADAIISAIDGRDAPFRIPVGHDAETVARHTRHVSFEALMSRAFGVQAPTLTPPEAP